MTCDRIKEHIYLYEELSNDDRAKVNDHVANCAQCAMVFTKFEEQQSLISKASSWQEPLDQPEKMTEHIMNAIGGRESKLPSIDMLLGQINLTPVRYALACLSLILITLFTWEYNQEGIGNSYANKTVATPLSKNTIALNSGKIFQRIQQRKKQPQALSLYDCFKKCRDTGTLELCNSCKSRFGKFLKNYEDS